MQGLSNPIQSKVKAGTLGAGGTGVSGGLVVLWLYKTITGEMMPAEVAIIIAGLLSSGGALFFGWLKRDRL